MRKTQRRLRVERYQQRREAKWNKMFMAQVNQGNTNPMLEITFRTDELTAIETFRAATAEQTHDMFSMISFIMERAILPADQDSLNEVAKMLWSQPVSQICSLFHDACFASAGATKAALEQVRAEVEAKNKRFGAPADQQTDTDSIFDEAADEGLEM
jgi:hypothetical protein